VFWIYLGLFIFYPKHSSKNTMRTVQDLHIEYVPITSLRPAEYNPRTHDKIAEEKLKESIERFSVVDPLIVNKTPERENVIIGGHFRLEVMKSLGHEMVPVVFVLISDIERERELNLRLNRNTGEFDLNLLAEFDEKLLADIGFSSEELDDIFGEDENPEVFDLEKELKKLEITSIDIKPGDMFRVGDSLTIRCGDSMVEADMLALMGDQKADMVLTDPPYILDYLKGKKKKDGKATEGFGLKRDRKYLGTDTLPDNFSDLWMANVAKVQQPNFSILIYENPKNLRTIWNAMEKHWRYRNTIVWRVPNRVQGFSAKYKFFNKHDIALVGTSGEPITNFEPEDDDLLQNEYETALYATSGKPHWEGYEKGKKYQPTDFIEHVAADEKHSGQGVIFGTKPIEVLIPYMKVLTKRGDVVLEPFGGSGSTAVAAQKLKRRCFLMEKSPVYTAVILKRLEKLTGLKPEKV
jgi:DNA modification methylase